MKFTTLLRNVFFAITTSAFGVGLFAASGQAQNTHSKLHKENIITTTSASTVDYLLNSPFKE